MLRLFALAVALALVAPAQAENPILAADLVGRYWAYKEKCERLFGAFAKEEVRALDRIAYAMGYDPKDDVANALAHNRKGKYVIDWVGKGPIETCGETQVFLRGLAKKLMQ